MRMSGSGGGSRPPRDAPNAPGARAAVVPLSQVLDLSAVMAAQGNPSGPIQYTGQDAEYPEEPPSQANSVLDADPYMQAGESLVPPDGMMPCHPPGDVTPSSVTSSRAGLHWNIPSRGSIPSPGNTSSRGDPRYADYSLCLRPSACMFRLLPAYSAILLQLVCLCAGSTARHMQGPTACLQPTAAS